MRVKHIPSDLSFFRVFFCVLRWCEKNENLHSSWVLPSVCSKCTVRLITSLAKWNVSDLRCASVLFKGFPLMLNISLVTVLPWCSVYSSQALNQCLCSLWCSSFCEFVPQFIAIHLSKRQMISLNSNYESRMSCFRLQATKKTIYDLMNYTIFDHTDTHILSFKMQKLS